MSFKQFESGREKDNARQELIEEHVEMLAEAQSRAEHRSRLERDQELRVEANWMLPAVAMDIFESFCRTCGNECVNPINIFDDDNKKSTACQNGKVSIVEMLEICAPNSVPKLDKDDDYPKQVCRLCLKKLEMVYEFQTNWLNAHCEFNVALKFEQRRKRCHKEAQAKSEDQLPELALEAIVVDIKSNDASNEPSPKPAPKLEKSVLPVITSPVPSVKQPQEAPYQCHDCDEKFYTSKAREFHYKFVHPDVIL
ncbi:uncharacterized protein Dlip1 [Drosophila tropicalis]|uniref:uncharacterized protein Dlip1 n=1 Tax=Drosophila tropicalis TaxID=46794 RepID=UPI0035ABDD6B